MSQKEGELLLLGVVEGDFGLVDSTYGVNEEKDLMRRIQQILSKGQFKEHCIPGEKINKSEGSNNFSLCCAETMLESPWRCNNNSSSFTTAVHHCRRVWMEPTYRSYLFMACGLWSPP